jgi:hypothetical protein
MNNFNFMRKTFSSLNIIPHIRSVVNIERQDFYPFMHPVVKNYLPKLKSKTSTYAKVFPKDITNFLSEQEKHFQNLENIEVSFYLNIGYFCRSIKRRQIIIN